MNNTKFPNSNDPYKEFRFKPDEMMNESMQFLKEKGMDAAVAEPTQQDCTSCAA